jgi:hypothetical protein
MTRRTLFGILAAAATAAIVDPERALWVPGRRKSFIPVARPIVNLAEFFHLGDVVTFDGISTKYIVTGFGDGRRVLMQLHFHPDAFSLIYPRLPPPRWRTTLRIS